MNMDNDKTRGQKENIWYCGSKVRLGGQANEHSTVPIKTKTLVLLPTYRSQRVTKMPTEIDCLRLVAAVRLVIEDIINLMYISKQHRQNWWEQVLELVTQVNQMAYSQ